MQNLFDRLAAVPLPTKLGVLAVTIGALLAGYWNFAYSDMVDEKEQLAEALKDLENLADALAKGEGECPSCGKKHGKDGKG